MGTILIRFSWPTLEVKSLVSQETLFRNDICTYPWSDKCKYILGEYFLLIFDYCGNYNSYPEFASYEQMLTIYPWFRFSYQRTSRKAYLETDNLELIQLPHVTSSSTHFMIIQVLSTTVHENQTEEYNLTIRAILVMVPAAWKYEVFFGMKSETRQGKCLCQL
jgi:hypothetical protein